MAEPLGFVGLGNMGAPMASRLLEAGHELWVTDLESEAVESLRVRGAHAARTPREVADNAGTVFLSLPALSNVFAVALSAEGLLHGTRIRCVVDFSTIGQRAALRVSTALAERGIAYVDAPVSGGVSGAATGRLALMVSCPKTVYEGLQPLFALFGKVFYVGERTGQAQTLKLANNLLNIAAIALTSEAMVMGVKAGLDPEMMLAVINAGTGRNSATQDKFPRAVLPGTFDYGFATGLSYKDVSLCIDEAEAAGVPMVVGAAVRQMLAITNALHGPQSDFTSVCRVVESWADVEVRCPGKPHVQA